MNYIDIILVIPLMWGAYKGYKKGLVTEIASLVALLLGIWGAIKFSGMTSDFLASSFDFTSEYLPIIAFALTFVVIVIGVHLVAKLVDKLVKAVALGLVNRILGSVFGALKFAFIISIILVILNQLDEKAKFIPKDLKEESLLYEPMSKVAPIIYPSVTSLEFDTSFI